MMQIRKLGWMVVLGGCVSGAAWAHGGHDMPVDQGVATPAAGLSVSGCWIRQLPSPLPSGGYLVIHNTGSAAVTLQSVQSPDYGQVMMHQTTESGGMSAMSMASNLQVPAGGTFTFKPGSYHLMMEHPRAGLKVGDVSHLQFRLENGQQFSADCDVKPANTLDGTDSGHASH